MILFVLAAALMVVAHLWAAWRRPRPAIFVSGLLWLLYAIYEHQVATGVLCDANCNIRVDLLLFFPILALATFCAYQSYEGREGYAKIIGMVLGILGLLVVALIAESFGYPVVSAVALLGALSVVIYAIRARRVARRA